MHPKNKHLGKYDFDLLVKHQPILEQYIRNNPRGEKTIDFSDPDAVRLLNKSLLLAHYDLTYWDIPEGYLCPPIPGRADYIHYVADLMQSSESKDIRCLDIGVGANLIYPIIGVAAYQWSFVGVDVDQKALAVAQKIIDQNKGLKNKIDLRHQPNAKNIFGGVVQPADHFHLSICNPPFYTSAAEAAAHNRRKNKNLGNSVSKSEKRNFGGRSNELWYPGGELAFIRQMIRESVRYKGQIDKFTTLVSKETHLKPLTKILKEMQDAKYQMIPMESGQKKSRILAWWFNS